MPIITKRDQDKSLFTVKKDSSGNIIVTQSSGKNGGEIRGSILRTNEGKPYIVAGYGTLIQSGSNVGYPGPGQITVSVDLDSIKDDIKKIASFSSTSSATRGPTGATGPTGPAGDQGPIGLTGAQGSGITSITDNGDGTVTLGFADGETSIINTPSATLSAGSVTMLPEGSTPTVTNVGTVSAAQFDFGIPTPPAGATGSSGVGFQPLDTFSFSTSLLSSKVTETIAIGSSPGPYALEFARTLWEPWNDYNIASTTSTTTWDLVAEISVDSDDASDSWEYTFKLQYLDGTTWTDFSASEPPGAPTTATTTVIEETHAGLSFDAGLSPYPSSGDPAILIRLLCEMTGIDTDGAGGVNEEITVTVYSARIKVRYTVL